jgi:hypothetical protein
MFPIRTCNLKNTANSDDFVTQGAPLSDKYHGKYFRSPFIPLNCPLTVTPETGCNNTGPSSQYNFEFLAGGVPWIGSIGTVEDYFEVGDTVSFHDTSLIWYFQWFIFIPSRYYFLWTVGADNMHQISVVIRNGDHVLFYLQADTIRVLRGGECSPNCFVYFVQQLIYRISVPPFSSSEQADRY